MPIQAPKMGVLGDFGPLNVIIHHRDPQKAHPCVVDTSGFARPKVYQLTTLVNDLERSECTSFSHHSGPWRYFYLGHSKNVTVQCSTAFEHA